MTTNENKQNQTRPTKIDKHNNIKQHTQQQTQTNINNKYWQNNKKQQNKHQHNKHKHIGKHNKTTKHTTITNRTNKPKQDWQTQRKSKQNKTLV